MNVREYPDWVVLADIQRAAINALRTKVAEQADIIKRLREATRKVPHTHYDKFCLPKDCARCMADAALSKQVPK